MELWTCADRAAGDAHGANRMLALHCCNLALAINNKIFLIFLGAEARHYEAGEINFTEVALWNMSAASQLAQLMNTTRNKIMESLRRWANNSNTQELRNTNNLRLSFHILLKPLNWESELRQPFICCYELFTHSHSLVSERRQTEAILHKIHMCAHNAANLPLQYLCDKT